jgi:methyl halide transferase
MAQHTRDWEARFRAGDTPWEDDAAAPSVVDLVREHAPLGARVLEIGCGRGTASVWLAEQGYRVMACDISPEAVRQARQQAETAGVDALFLAADVLADTAYLPVAEVVFTRGVLHTFTTAEGRAMFAAAVARCLSTAGARCLSTAGVWLDLSGSADTPDAPGERTRCGLPRLTLGELASAEHAFQKPCKR